MLLGDLIDEAAELGGLDPSALTHRHLQSIKRSLAMLQIELETEGLRPEWRQETKVLQIAANMNYVLLPADTIDVLDVSWRQDGQDRPLARTTRQNYLAIANKSVMGQPQQFWVSKSLPTELMLGAEPMTGWGEGLYGYGTFGGEESDEQGNLDRKMLVLWPGTNIDGYIVCNRLREHAAPGALGEAVDARRNWWPTLVYGLAAKIAEKYSDDKRLQYLLGQYRDKLDNRKQDENEGDVVVAVRGFGWARERRI